MMSCHHYLHQIPNTPEPVLSATSNPVMAGHNHATSNCFCLLWGQTSLQQEEHTAVSSGYDHLVDELERDERERAILDELLDLDLYIIISPIQRVIILILLNKEAEKKNSGELHMTMMMDSTIDMSTKAQESIFVRTASKGLNRTVFLRIAEPEETTGEQLLTVIEEALTKISTHQ